MKKFIFFALIATTFCSCGVNYVVTTADITWMTALGDTVKTWEDAKIQSNVVESGTSAPVINPVTSQSAFFKDADNNVVSITGGMILIENIKQLKCEPNSNTSEEAILRKMQSVVDAYYSLEDELEAIDKEISISSKDGYKLDDLRAKKKDIKKQMRELSSLYFNKTYKNIPSRNTSK